MKKTIKIKAYVDDEEQRVTMKFDNEEGYIILTFSDYNKTEIKLDWKTVENICKDVCGC